MTYLPQAEPTYRLADHMRACLIDDQVILLDLHRNKYLGIGGGSRLAALSRVVRDWPIRSADESLSDDDIVATAIAPLIRQGMLASALEAAPARQTSSEPLHTLALQQESSSSPLEWRHMVSLWLCAAVASHWIRRRTLAEIVMSVAAMKHRMPLKHQSGQGALQTTVATYMRFRPFALTAHDRCLHDSLTLTRFLASRGLSAQWVIGVRTNPFGAHSWVQQDHVVLNDLHENVRRYRPILVA